MAQRGVLMATDRAREQQHRQRGRDPLGSHASATGTSMVRRRARLGPLSRLARPHVHDAGADRGLELAGMAPALLLPWPMTGIRPAGWSAPSGCWLVSQGTPLSWSDEHAVVQAWR
jgi:hypothetical protein